VIGRLYTYFGVVGTASVVGYLATWVILVACARSPKRTRFYAYAFLLSLLALLLAWINSHNISNIEVDRTEQIEAMRAKQAAAREEEEEAKSREPETKPAARFAEETPEEAKDLAGKGQEKDKPAEKGTKGVTADEAKAAAKGAEEELSKKGVEDGADDAERATEGRRHAYREQGKKAREEGKKRKIEDVQDVVETKKAVSARMMPEADVIAADRFDRVNLFFARLTPWLALALVCLDYLSRFNKTFGYYFPLPIAGRIVDALFPKTHSVHLHTASVDPRPTPPPTGSEPSGGDQGVLRQYLEDVLRKGESFIYFGPTDLWQAPELHRITLRKRKLGAVTKLTYDSADALADSRFIFDSVWFGRYCFVVTDAEAARKLVGDLIDYLRMRRIPRAAAWSTVHIVWAFEASLPHESLRELLLLSKETNFKLVVVSAGPPPEALAPAFEERIDLAAGAPADSAPASPAS